MQSDEILSDQSSGLITDRTGRRFFRQRKVKFRTLKFTSEDLHDHFIPGSEGTLKRLNWTEQPSHRQIREYAAEASRRFLNFWYRVYDVALARGVSGRDRSVFRMPPAAVSSLADIGIPENPDEASCPPELASVILTEYKKSIKTDTEYLIFYITEYLNTVNEDIIRELEPWGAYWDLEEDRRLHSGNTADIYREIMFAPETQSLMLQRLDSMLAGSLKTASGGNAIRMISSENVRKLIHRIRSGETISSFSSEERFSMISENKVLNISEEALKIHHLLQSQELLLSLLRSGLFHQAGSFRTELKLIRFSLFSKSGNTDYSGSFTEKLNRHRKESRSVLQKLDQFRNTQFSEKAECVIRWLKEQKQKDDAVLAEYRKASGASQISFINDSVQDRFRLPGTVIPGDPFSEPAVTDFARRTLRKRLRPLRMAAGAYSTVSDQRHAAITLNPVLRLWKDRPGYREKNLPERIRTEINTKEVIESLLHLACIADPLLNERETVRDGSARNLRSALFFLTPGSCFPLREISRYDFPEFRGKVIGETRSPAELGVPETEESILTGGWYSRRNHAFYYPMGGDNGSLLYSIWKAARLSGPAAFFFATGQFVHDSLPESLIYYKNDTVPFRLITEDYYRREDLTMKNRGERTGRRKADNSRDGIRFMFAVTYSRFLMELLTGSPQSSFRHRPSENWFREHLGFTGIYASDTETVRSVRRSVMEFLTKD